MAAMAALLTTIMPAMAAMAVMQVSTAVLAARVVLLNMARAATVAMAVMPNILVPVPVVVALAITAVMAAMAAIAAEVKAVMPVLPVRAIPQMARPALPAVPVPDTHWLILPLQLIPVKTVQPAAMALMVSMAIFRSRWKAAVGGDVIAVSNANVSVTLGTGAAVGGVISAEEASTSTLTFEMKGTQEDVDALNAVLSQPGGGSVMIGGEKFTWSNFDELVNKIQLYVAKAKAKAGDQSGSRIAIQRIGGENMIMIYDANHQVILQISESDARSQMSESGAVYLGSAGYTYQGLQISVAVYVTASGTVRVVETWPDGSTSTFSRGL